MMNTKIVHYTVQKHYQWLRLVRGPDFRIIR
jgi:hypothetical protein